MTEIESPVNKYIDVYINNYVRQFRNFITSNYIVNIDGVAGFIATDDHDLSFLLRKLQTYGFEVAMVGGGTNPQPGEISLAHNGLLFLDELPEFNRSVLEVLRQPLEDRYISISRAKYSLDYPASFMLVASMNPCPCGYYNHPTRACVCNPGQVQRYLNRISGPLLDRIDIQIEIVPVPFEKMAEQHHAESSASIRKRVIKARKIQAQRFANHPGIYCNAQMEAGLLHLYAQPNEAGLKLLQTAMTRLNLSARAYGRILKVARTIADLDNSEHITSIHLAEAISYRNLDREDWAG